MSRALTAGMLLLLASPAFADRNSFDIEYFVVTGKTAQALRSDIEARGPIGETGRRGDGYTRWHIGWTYGMDSVEGRCTPGKVVVDLDIHMILPRWNPARDVDPDLISQWNRYAAAVRIHEDGHRHLAEAAARDARRALQAEGPARNCDALKTRMDSSANRLLDKLREQQAAYDRDTNHGQAQGVRRP